MKRNRILLCLLACITVLGLAGCCRNTAPVAEEPKNVRVITDRTGRSVEVPEEVSTIVCLGSGAPRIAAYLQAPVKAP